MSGETGEPVTDLAKVRREREAQDDGRCVECGHFPALCSPMGRPCCYRETR